MHVVTLKVMKAGSSDEKSYKVGISQFVTHPSLDSATEGFKKALEEEGLSVEYDEQNANGDQTNCSNNSS